MAYEADGRFDSSSPSIRGVFGVGTTGFYIDDTQVNSSILPRVMDLERIEVLRGPQGSLYGARSMGGTIRMITAKPQFDNSDSQVHATLSTVDDGDENWNFDGIFNFPVIEDKFAIRVTAYYGSNSGVFDRTYIPTWTDSGGNPRVSPGPAFEPNENIDDEEYWGGNLAATWIFTDNLSLDMKLMGQKVEADDTEEPGTDEWYIASATFNWAIDAGNFVSTTALYDRETDESEEEATFLWWLFDNVIGIPIDPVEAPLSTVEKYSTFSHETRFTSDFNGDWNFTAGVFYQDADFDHHYPAAIFVTQTDTTIEELAFFGEISWQLNDTWSITAGGRWYDTEITSVNATDGFANSGVSSFDEKQSESGFNPKLLVQAQLNDDWNLYGSAAQGFRVGGVNGNLPSGLCGPELDELGIDPSNATTYDSDSLWSYELGFKSSLADNRVTLNGAVFFIDWSDVQQFNRLACGFQFTANAGSAESTGFELELAAAPMAGLSLSAAVGYTDAEITDAGGVAGVAKGDKVQGVPDWTGTLSVHVANLR